MDAKSDHERRIGRRQDIAEQMNFDYISDMNSIRLQKFLP